MSNSNPAKEGLHLNPDTTPNPRPCEDGQGVLASCSPLAVPNVPFQQKGSQKYEQSEALANGTLFPGLDLPFHLKAKAASVPEGAAAELQALCFVITELGLYLDTHQDDQEAVQLFQQYTRLAEEGKRRYEAMYGPLTQRSAIQNGRYVWLNDPWPWEYHKEGGNK